MGRLWLIHPQIDPIIEMLVGFVAFTFNFFKLVYIFLPLLFFWRGQVSYLATDNCFPEWKIWSQFLHESTEGLRLDGLAESHPIEVLFNLHFSCV